MKSWLTPVLLCLTSSAWALEPGEILITGLDSSDVQVFSEATGAHLREFAGTGLNRATGIAVGPDGDVYVSSLGNNKVVRYDGDTGALIGDFVTTNLSNVQRLAFGPDGNLYACNGGPGNVKRFDGTTGAYIDDFITVSPALSIRFHSDGLAYVTAGNNIYRYDSETGTLVDLFYNDAADGTTLGQASSLDWAPNGEILVARTNSGNISRHDPTTGEYLGLFASGAASAYDLRVRNDGTVWVTDAFGGHLYQYDVSDGTLLLDINADSTAPMNGPFAMAFGDDTGVPPGPPPEPIARLLQQGRLLDAQSRAVTGPRDLSVSLYTGETGGSAVWSSTFSNVPFDVGYFAVTLSGQDDTGRSLDAVLDGSTLWMALDVGDGELGARQAVRTVASAVRAHGVPLIDASDACTLVGGLGYDTGLAGLYVCDGSSWSAVGGP